MPACPRCGEANSERSRFCSACGAQLTAAEPAREVRKTVTVIFTDVIGSTTLGERMDPESMRHVMGRYFERMRSVLESHGGTVEKFIGDAVMAVFGIPQTHEDDALRAVRAAADMATALEPLNEDLRRDHGVTLAVRTGVNTGEVVAGDPVAGQALVTGDAVNIAARLEQIAEPGEILIGAATFRLVRDAVDAEAIEPKLVKGKEQPVRAFRLLDVRRDSAAHTRRLETPLVGRDHELALLAQAYQRVVREKSCHLFTLLGSAGVGKTRLTEEFVQRLPKDATVLRGRCLPYGQGITFWAVAEVVKQGAGITQADSADDARSKLESVLAGENEAPLICERLAQLTGLGGGAAAPEETFWAARKMFESLARKGSLTLVFDDIHWAEPAFLDLIEHIADWTRDAPILLLCLARQELLEARPGWAGGKFNATSLLLEPLRDEECKALIHDLLGAGLSEEVSQRILNSAEGNPLFVEETLVMLMDDGSLRRENGHWVPASDLSKVTVPASIQALLAARLDGLAAEERQVLEVAAVEGKLFHRGAVEQLTPASLRQGVRGQLRALTRKELIRPDRPEFAGEDAFRFRHLLIRDAAYQRMPKELRADLHERFAGWMERASGDRASEYGEILGYHLEESCRYRAELRAAEMRGTEVANRAAGYLGSAGRKALARGDALAAINLLRRAAALLLAKDRRRVELLSELAGALLERGEFTSAEAVLSQALADARAMGDRQLEAYAELQQLELRFMTEPEGISQEAEEQLTRMMPAFEQLGDHLGLAKSWLLLGGVRNMACHATGAEEAYRQGFAHARQAGDQVQESRCLTWQALTLIWGSTPVSVGMRVLDEILHQSRGSRQVRGAVLVAQAALTARKGELDEAWRIYEEAEATFFDLGMKVTASAAAIVSHEMTVAGGSLERAEGKLRRGCELLQEFGEKSYLSTVAAYLAENLYQQGRYDDAEHFTHISEEAAASQDLISQILWRGARAKVLARRGETKAALALVEEALALAAGTDSAWTYEVWWDFAEVLDLAGRGGEARRQLQRVLELAEQREDRTLATAVRRRLAELAASSSSPAPVP